MSAISSIPPPPISERVFRLTVDQYHTMINTGVLTDDDPVELLEGVLVFTMPKNPPHSFVVDAAADLIRRLIPRDWSYRQQEPITLDDGEPEPDGAVVRGSRHDYRTRHPGPRDIAMVIEVADTSISTDRSIKLRSYARASIPEYWIINLVDRCVEVYTKPDPGAPEPTYHGKQIRGANEAVLLAIAGKELGIIAVRELLP
jgi:Uma2 family endonuclease